MSLQTKHKDVTFHVGDTVRIFYRIIEREKVAGKTKRSQTEEVHERLQPYEGIVTGIKGSEENTSFTVRRIATGAVGVERVFPLISPWLDHVVVKSRGKVRRAKLHYLRGRSNMDVKRVDDVNTKKSAKSADAKPLSPKRKKSAAKKDAKRSKHSSAKAARA